MSSRTDRLAKELAMAVARQRAAGCTNKEISRTLSVDVKRVPGLAKLGATLLTLAEPTSPHAGQGG